MSQGIQSQKKKKKLFPQEDIKRLQPLNKQHEGYY